MDTTKLKNFSQEARRSLLDQIEGQLNIVLASQSLARRESSKAVSALEEEINKKSREEVIEQVAYIWFNRFCALRFMDVNRYNRIGIVSPASDETLPEILSEALSGHIDDNVVPESIKKRVQDLLLGRLPSRDAQGEVYRLLLVAYCNSLNKSIPCLFERIANYVEILLPANLLAQDSVLSSCREALTVEACKDVEVIGWLYQYYISEKKDEVFKSFKKKKKAGPKEIPAATQLFTPHWIVKYLVDNSLGRLWMLNNPDSSLIDKMEYYIKPKEEINDFLIIQSPEEIKVNDPACGSGHMLTYAFDLLYFIYEEEGYDPASIPTLILKNNLYGIEIDERAGELAAFALLMKARAKDRKFLENPTKPNICKLQNISFDETEINDYKSIVGSDILTPDIIDTLNQFEESDNFGSLIIPKATNIKETIEKLSILNMDSDFFIQDIHEKILKALKQADYLSKKYHIVVANPPYMGGGNMNPRLAKWVKKEYPSSKSDMCTCFIERNLQLGIPKSFSAIITMQSWMFLSSFEKLRDEIISNNTIISMAHLGTRAFNSIGGEVVSTTAFILENEFTKEYKGEYIRLVDDKDEESKWLKLLEAIKNPNCGWFYRVSADNFKKIPGSPIAYWASEKMLDIFFNNKMLGKIVEPRQGMATTNNNRFLKLWQEVSNSKIGLGFESADQAKFSKKKWFAYNKGGEYRKWYGNNNHVVNYEEDGRDLKIEVKQKYRNRDYAKGFSDERWDKLIEVWVLKNQQFYFKPSVTWTYISSTNFGARYCPKGFIFDVAGSSIFPNEKDIYVYTGLMCSILSSYFLKVLNPTLNFQVENIAAIPIIEQMTYINSDFVKKSIKLSKLDWDSYETSWDFTTSPLLDNDYKSNSLLEIYNKARSHWNEMTLEMQSLEEENNKIFIEAYGLEDELTPEVPLKEITLTCNPHYRYKGDKTIEELEVLLLADTMREYISYAVGCMFGRYSIDKPGLILANQGETYKDYCELVPNSSFSADEDNVIPILDDEWFSDDIVYKFKNFVKITFGEEKYNENIRFIEDSIGKDIRNYFLKDFYNDHVRRYKKRPIYWMFSSPNGGFNALIYMHRYKSDIVSVVRSNYLVEYISKISYKIEHLERIAASVDLAKSEKTKSLKEINVLRKRVDELSKYEKDVLFPLATRKVEIDLDDGVKVNYPKLGKALKKVPGLSLK